MQAALLSFPKIIRMRKKMAENQNSTCMAICIMYYFLWIHSTEVASTKVAIFNSFEVVQEVGVGGLNSFCSSTIWQNITKTYVNRWTQKGAKLGSMQTYFTRNLS